MGCFGIVLGSWLLERSHTERKMETIRKKLDMLRETLNNAESRAHSAEDELKKAKERNATVRILAGFCSFTLAEMRLKLYILHSQAKYPLV